MFQPTSIPLGPFGQLGQVGQAAASSFAQWLPLIQERIKQQKEELLQRFNFMATYYPGSFATPQGQQLLAQMAKAGYLIPSGTQPGQPAQPTQPPAQPTQAAQLPTGTWGRPEGPPTMPPLPGMPPSTQAFGRPEGMIGQVPTAMPVTGAFTQTTPQTPVPPAGPSAGPPSAAPTPPAVTPPAPPVPAAAPQPSSAAITPARPTTPAVTTPPVTTSAGALQYQVPQLGATMQTVGSQFPDQATRQAIQDATGYGPDIWDMRLGDARDLGFLSDIQNAAKTIQIQKRYGGTTVAAYYAGRNTPLPENEVNDPLSGGLPISGFIHNGQLDEVGIANQVQAARNDRQLAQQRALEIQNTSEQIEERKTAAKKTRQADLTAIIVHKIAATMSGLTYHDINAVHKQADEWGVDWDDAMEQGTALRDTILKGHMIETQDPFTGKPIFVTSAELVQVEKAKADVDHAAAVLALDRARLARLNAKDRADAVDKAGKISPKDRYELDHYQQILNANPIGSPAYNDAASKIKAKYHDLNMDYLPVGKTSAPAKASLQEPGHLETLTAELNGAKIALKTMEDEYAKIPADDTTRAQERIALHQSIIAQRAHVNDISAKLDALKGLGYTPTPRGTTPTPAAPPTKPAGAPATTPPKPKMPPGAQAARVKVAQGKFKVGDIIWVLQDGTQIDPSTGQPIR